MNLESIREQIDAIDKEMLELFIKRMSCVEKVGMFKHTHGLPILDTKRETTVIQNKLELLDNPLLIDEATAFFTTLMVISKGLQYNLLQSGGTAADTFSPISKEAMEARSPAVVFQGVEGSYSEEALSCFFDGVAVRRISVQTFEHVFETILSGEADYGVVPIENSTTGAVIDIYDLLVFHNCYIVGEQLVKVDHQLMAIPGATIDTITDVYSHPQALDQIKSFLKEKPGWNIVPQLNTAMSAKYVKEHSDPSKAAVASRHAAEQYGLHILREDINSSKSNYTRFLIISKNPMRFSSANKISILFSLPHTCGALYNILFYFKHNHINMYKIESRPMPDTNWEYVFFIDFEGSLDDKNVQYALNAIQNECAAFQLLGNYIADKQGNAKGASGK